MSSEEIKAVKYTCGGCGRVTIIEQGEQKPEGYHGLMEFVSSRGEIGGEVYACRKGCLLKAVTAIVDPRADDDDIDDLGTPTGEQDGGGQP